MSSSGGQEVSSTVLTSPGGLTVTDMSEARQFGVGRGKVFPASKAQSLVNPLRRLVQSPKRTVAAMHVASDADVLEIGCGPGFFSPHLAAAAPAGRVVLVDLQHEMLTRNRERNPLPSNLVRVQSDAMSLPFPDSQFDAVLLVAVLGEIPDLPACLHETRRVLRTGGVATVAETRRDSDFISLPDLRRRVEPAGFSYLDRRGISWQYVARFRRTDG